MPPAGVKDTMAAHSIEVTDQQLVVALVDGDAAVRRERQLMLRSENFQVRSYGSNEALIADSRAHASDCIVADMENRGEDLLRRLRAEGWRGKAILLGDTMMAADPTTYGENHGDMALPRSVGDRALLQAILSVLAGSTTPPCR